MYKADEIQIQLEPLAKWCRADYIQKKVVSVSAGQNLLKLEDGSTLDYDVLIMNVGSKTRGSEQVSGIWENSLTTRPINYLLKNLENKENYLLENNIVPEVIVCGSGAAGTELAFGYKARWSRLFK